LEVHWPLLIANFPSGPSPTAAMVQGRDGLPVGISAWNWVPTPTYNDGVEFCISLDWVMSRINPIDLKPMITKRAIPNIAPTEIITSIIRLSWVFSLEI